MKSQANTALPRILMVDDEIAILRMLEVSLGSDKYSLHRAESGRLALVAAVAVKPDIILLDLGLPDMDGVEVIRRIREWSQVPIVVLSVRDRENDKVDALNMGADDYLTKPFGIAELRARIQAALRRALQQAPEPVYKFGEMEIDLALRKVLVAGREIALTPTEYGILRLLATHAGRVLTHNQILKQIWGIAYSEQQNALRVNISHLRQKIEKDASRPQYIITEPGIGYRLKT